MPSFSLSTFTPSQKRRKALPVNLPDELLVIIVQGVANTFDTSAAYRDLLALSLVSKQWSRVAKAVLYARVQLAKSDEAPALTRTLEASIAAGSRIDIESLVVGVGHWQVQQSQLDRLLVLAPGIRKLAVFTTDHGYDFTPRNTPEQLSFLTSLVDVTIVAASVRDDMTTLQAFISLLPSQVRFLHLPGDEAAALNSTNQVPIFQLYGLTIPRYPSPIAEWVLSRSGSTLQFLTTGSITNVSYLASHHPNLRSLRILGRYNASMPDFATLRNLERLELRARNLLQSIVETLPSSLRYLRFWSTYIARGLEELFGSLTWRDALPSLQTNVWDYWPAEDGPESGVFKRLKEVCREHRIEFRICPTTEQGERASEGHDVAYEAFLRTSCCTNGPNQDAPIVLSPSLRSSTIRIPTRIFSTLIANCVSIRFIFLTSIGGRPQEDDIMSIVKDYFGGLRDWVTNILPRELQKRAPVQEVDPIYTAPRRLLPQGMRNIRERFIALWLPFFLISSTSVFGGAIALYFTVITNHPGPKVAVAFGSAVLIFVLRCSGNSPMRDHGRFEGLLKAVVAVYIWALSFLTCIAAVAGNSVTRGLGLTGGIFMFFLIWFFVTADM